jgi:catechol 2,3-dioxygenase-like lactoylglutathione lyase family enzyme
MAVYGGFHHVHLVSRDPEASAAWYQEALGAEVAGRSVKKNSLSITLTLGEARLSVRGLRAGEDPVPDETPAVLGINHIGLMVDDIEGAIKRVVDCGGGLTDPVHTGSSGNLVAFVQTPEGVAIEFLQPKS